MSNLFNDSFGNYMLHGIDEIQLPAPVSWWPQTLGWQLLLLAVLLWLGWYLVGRGRRWWRYRYRRLALAQLADLEKQAAAGSNTALRHLPELLKATALHAYPRVEVAGLHGEAWLEFLDGHYEGPAFASATGRQLLALAYQAPEQLKLETRDRRQLLSMCRRWLGRHYDPQREARHHA